MGRSIIAATSMRVASLAAPAAGNPIALVSGPSPVAIVSGILTVSGSEVNAGDLGLDATTGSLFAGNWPGFTGRTSDGQPSAVWPGRSTPTGRSRTRSRRFEHPVLHLVRGRPAGLRPDPRHDP